MDAIVMGKLKGFHESQDTTFVQTMRGLAKQLEGAAIDFETVPPLELIDVASVYDGPIVSVGMFGAMGAHDYELSLATKHVLAEEGLNGDGIGSGRTNIDIVNGRKYLAALGEYGPDSFKDKNDCNEGRRDAHKMHRCNGKHGGHPDFIAWEVCHKLHQLTG